MEFSILFLPWNFQLFICHIYHSLYSIIHCKRTEFKAYKIHLLKLMLFLPNLFHFIEYNAFEYFIYNSEDSFVLEEDPDVVIFLATLFLHLNFVQILAYFHFFSSLQIYSIVLILCLNYFMVILILIVFFSFSSLRLISYQTTFFLIVYSLVFCITN